jgi:uncharacterized membrane protein
MLWILALGVATGARSMTAMAVVCWFGWLRLFPLANTWASWAGTLIAAIAFTVFAAAEYFADTRPEAGPRTAPGPLAVRVVVGGVAGAVAATALMEPAAGGVILALIGVFIGAFGGIRLRYWLAARWGRDLPAALTGSGLALAISLLAAFRLHSDAVRVAAQEGRTFL